MLSWLLADDEAADEGRVIDDDDVFEETPLAPAIELIPAAADWTRDLSVDGH